MPATGPPLLVARLRSLLGIASPEAAAGSSPTTLEMPLEDLIKEVQYLHHALQHAQGIQKEREDHPGDDLETLGLQFLDACADRARKEKETVESSRLRNFYSEKFDGKVPDGPADEDAKWTRAFALASKLATVTDEAVLIAARRGISYSDPALYEIRTFQFPMASTSVDIKPIKADPISVDLRLLKSPTSTFGLAQWGSGILLSNMITLGIIPLKAPVIDVGTGAGLVGITAAKKLASSERLGFGPLVTLSDAPTPVLVNVKHNLVANGVDNPSLATVVHLDWAELGDSSKLKKYKTIVASDVIYDLETGTQLARVMAALLERTPEARIYVLIPARLGFDRPLEFFMREMLPTFGEGKWSEVDGGLISPDVWEESAMVDGFRLGEFRWDELQDGAGSSKL